MRVISYVRVSTSEQARDGLSLGVQESRMRAYCEAHGHELLRIEKDAGVSARRTSNRPALQRALRTLTKGGADGLVAVKLDRLSRTTRDVLDLVARAEKERWTLHSMEEKLDTSTPIGRFVVTVFGALAQLEREQASARSREILLDKMARGEAAGGCAPFGLGIEGGRLVVAPSEREQLARMETMRAGGLSCAAIATALPAHPRTGRPWTRLSVWRVLRTAARRAS